MVTPHHKNQVNVGQGIGEVEVLEQTYRQRPSRYPMARLMPMAGRRKRLLPPKTLRQMWATRRNREHGIEALRCPLVSQDQLRRRDRVHEPLQLQQQ